MDVLRQIVEEFAASWSLFASSYVTGWLIAALLGLVGVVVLAQRQVFAGVAIAQASSFGIALAFATGAVTSAADDHHALHGVPLLFGTGAAIAAALWIARPSRAVERPDALAAFVFLVGSAGSVVLLADHPNGLEEVERLMFSTLIGADDHDVVEFVVLLGIAVLALVPTHRTLLLATTDAATARALGVRVGRIETLAAVGLGTALGAAMHSAGTLYSFGCLLLPALTSKQLCRSMRPMFVVAPLVAVGTTVVAFVWANHADLPPGQAAVVVQGAVLALASGARHARGRG